MEGRTPSEIARELGIKRNAVDAILHRARRSLAAKLDGGGVLGRLRTVRVPHPVPRAPRDDAVTSVDPSGQAAPAGLAFATMGMAAVLSLSGTASAVVTEQPTVRATSAAHSAVTESVRKVEKAPVTRSAPLERVQKVAQSTYEMDVVRAPVTNPVTGEQEETRIWISAEPTGGRRSVVDDVLEPIFMGCVANGACTEYRR